VASAEFTVEEKLSPKKDKSVLPPFRSTCRYPHLLLSAGACCTAHRRPIDIFCPQSAERQTRRPLLLLSIDGTDRLTGGL